MDFGYNPKRRDQKSMDSELPNSLPTPVYLGCDPTKPEWRPASCPWGPAPPTGGTDPSPAISSIKCKQVSAPRPVSSLCSRPARPRPPGDLYARATTLHAKNTQRTRQELLLLPLGKVVAFTTPGELRRKSHHPFPTSRNPFLCRIRRPPRERKTLGSNPACDGNVPGRVIPVT